MKVGYLMPEWPGQAHVWAWREISHLRELGLDITIFSTRAPQALGKHSFTAIAQSQTSYLWPLPIGYMLTVLGWALLNHPRGLWDCIKLGFTLPLEQKPAWKTVLPLIVPACYLARKIQAQNIQHLHTPIPSSSAILAMLVKRLINRPFSITVVAPFEDWGGAMQEKMAEATFVTVVAQWMEQQMHRDFAAIPPSHCSITRHGVDTQKWVPKPDSRSHTTHSNTTQQPKQIFSIGRLAPSKGFDILLQALAQVKATGLDFQLKIAGEGPERANLEALIADLDLSAQVELMGSVSEDQCLVQMQAADLFVSASRAEGFSVARQEAMAVGVATIASNIVGAEELIVDQVNGLLVPPEQAVPLAEGITRLLLDDQLRTQIARAGRQTILDHFDSRVGATALYTRIIESVPESLTQNATQSKSPKTVALPA